VSFYGSGANAIYSKRDYFKFIGGWIINNSHVEARGAFIQQCIFEIGLSRESDPVVAHSAININKAASRFSLLAVID
jgi:hypothetical protein